MTTRQIAEIANVSESTVRNWIGSAGIAEVSAKIAKARETSIAADFTLEETIASIRAGGNDTLAYQKGVKRIRELLLRIGHRPRVTA